MLLPYSSLPESASPLTIPSEFAARQPIKIGWAERILLLLNWPHGPVTRLRLRAKIDTGAKTSSLHAVNIQAIETKQGPLLRFTIPYFDQSIEAEAPLLKLAPVKSSAGKQVMRYFIKASVRIGHFESNLIFTLNDRSQMRYPVLLGRSFLCDHFLVDSGRRFLHGKPR